MLNKNMRNMEYKRKHWLIRKQLEEKVHNMARETRETESSIVNKALELYFKTEDEK